MKFPGGFRCFILNYPEVNNDKIQALCVFWCFPGRADDERRVVANLTLCSGGTGLAVQPTRPAGATPLDIIIRPLYEAH